MFKIIHYSALLVQLFKLRKTPVGWSVPEQGVWELGALSHPKFQRHAEHLCPAPRWHSLGAGQCVPALLSGPVTSTPSQPWLTEETPKHQAGKCRVSARCAPRLWKAKARACTLPEPKGCAQQERGLAVMNLTPQLPVPAHAAPAWQSRLKGLGCDTEPSKHSSDTAAVSQQDEGLV